MVDQYTTRPDRNVYVENLAKRIRPVLYVPYTTRLGYPVDDQNTLLCPIVPYVYKMARVKIVDDDDPDPLGRFLRAEMGIKKS